MATVTDIPLRTRWLALGAVLGTQFMLVVDASVVNLALPVIQKDLDLDQAGLTWIVNAYMIAFGAFLLVAGRLGDLAGRRRVLLGGLVVFTLGSLACAVAPTGATLIAARFVQGLGGGFASAVILAVVTTTFPEPDLRARAMSLYMFVSVGGGSAGLLLGGIVTQAVDWHWIFLVNVPIGVAVVFAIRRLVVEDRPEPTGERVDVLSAVVITTAIMLGIFAIVRSPDAGWGSATTIVSAALALALLGVFAVLQVRLAQPLLPVRLLRNRTLTVANLIRAGLGTGMYGFFFLTALYLEKVLDYSTLRAGIAFLPQTLIVAALSTGLSARIMARVGPYRLLIGGLTALAAGLALLTQIPVDGEYFPVMLASLSLFGIGAGTAFLPLLTLALGDVPTADAGTASALVNVSLYVSSAVGLAVLGALADAHTRSLRASGTALDAARVSGYHLGFGVAAALVVAGAALAVAYLRPRAAVRTP